VLDGSGTPSLPTFISINFDPNSIGEYLAGMAPLDPTVRHLVAHPEQAIVHDGLLTNDRDKDSRTITTGISAASKLDPMLGEPSDSKVVDQRDGSGPILSWKAVPI
jgi:hypothetical protein